ncbi:hypothetical protein TCA2_4446 [Paenibacillus sp. TCA20]|uniref:Na-translocating system protein MpsC family protein n=1 Tax=Paenibacillus sp. TCA20 TaxID=1499968 RepID=UPI0004D6655C|nr:Na-translocating system protein MpsC family protein [Paenibacillus sp. TCA20]GAK41954.1 hypothetical protein TCA2_4446 [Paenibacillus sp. TCA20]
MEIRQLEKNLAMESARIGKKVIGRGPTECRVRIIDSMIVIRCRLEMTQLEKLMYKHLEISNVTHAMIEDYKKILLPMISVTLASIHSDLEVTDSYLKLNTEGGFSVFILNMNMDIEKLIAQERVTGSKSVTRT